ncbi:TNR18 factor, partial [Cettia cetti]|nr:TNR18 factor [Cettia cetti]
AENPRPCATEKDHDCKCPPGYGCSDRSCLSCRSLPRCPPGSEPARIGIADFRFECEPCQNGTYSSSRNSWCRNWTDCGSSGLLTLRAGNSSHDAVC